VSSAAKALFEGTFVLILSLAVWRMTGSTLGWFMLFAPGAVLVGVGLWRLGSEE
jgi:hypothetical protein